MRIAYVSFVAALVAVAACGEVPAPTVIDAALPIDAVDAIVIDTPTDAQLAVSRSGSGSGTVTSSPAGIACGATCSARFTLGSTVTLTATPDLGSALVTWGGACSGSSPTCVLTITADTNVTADFGPSLHQVTVTTGGAGTGTVVSSPAGINCGNGNTQCAAPFAFGAVVTLTATPTAGSLFGGWSGGVCSGIGPCTFTVNGDAAVNADFALDNFTLIVSKVGNGNGTVTSSPAGINCGATCTAGYSSGQMVTLTATPTADSVFNGWSGACTGTGTCVVTMTQSRMVTASFTLQQFLLTVTRAGGGTGTVTSTPVGVNCGVDCTEAYASGTVVTLAQAAAAGSVFTGWSGACTGTGACVVTMTAARAVTATFAIQQFTLTVTPAGTGTGTVSSSPAGISCGADCTENYNSGTVVTLTATPGASSTFAGWSGACTGTGTCVVTMTAARAVTATFNATLVTITIAKTGPLASGAIVTSSPAGINCGATCSGSFAPGTVLTLTQAVGGSIFNGWSGAGCSGTGNCTFTVGAAATVTAGYRAIRVAISAGATSCIRAAGESGPRLINLLAARGHTAVLATGLELDTTAEINAHDVIVTAGPGSGCAAPEASVYDAIIDAYIRTTGRGVVVTGWFLYVDQGAPNLWNALPTVQNMNYLSGAQPVTTVAGHPITAGVGAFSTGEWLPYGGGPKPGATSLLLSGGNSVGAAWSLGTGRAVYLGPMYMESYAAYQNENLLDGTQAAPIELILRAIEWAAKGR